MHDKVMTRHRYIIITPARNEGDYLPQTIASVAAQTIRPALWVIVNDGSTDDTGRKTEEASARHDWIRVLHRQDRGHR